MACGRGKIAIMGQGKRRLAFKLAWHRTVTQLAGSYQRAALSAFIALAGGYGAYGVSALAGREWPGDELIPLYVTGTILGCLWLVLFFYNWLFAVPYIKWTEAENRVVELEQKITPTVAFTLENGGYAKEFPVGSATQAVSGDYITNQSGHERYICARIDNRSLSDATSAQVSLTRLTSENGKHLSDPIDLAWHNRRFSGGYEFINAGSPRTALLFRVGLNGVYIASAEKLTLEQASFFDGSSSYEGRVAISHGNSGVPLLVDFMLKLEPEPHLAIVED